MPAERERERERDRDNGRASEPGTRQLRSDSDSSAAANSRSVKRRDDDGGDPARHGRPRTSGWQSRPSGGRDKDERRDPFRRAKRSAVRSARRSRRGRKGGRKRGTDRVRREGCGSSIGVSVLRTPNCRRTNLRGRLKELEERRSRKRDTPRRKRNRGGESNGDERRHEFLIDNSINLIGWA